MKAWYLYTEGIANLKKIQKPFVGEDARDSLSSGVPHGCSRQIMENEGKSEQNDQEIWYDNFYHSIL